jgi:hypothetical protein
VKSRSDVRRPPALLLLALALFVPCASNMPTAAQVPPVAPTAEAPAALDSALLEDLYGRGREFGAFLDTASARREQWVANYEQGRVLDDLVARARAVPGRWRLLVVTVDACSDSVSTLPYLARLAEAVETIDLRVVDPEAGGAVMEARRSPDGRATTPTLVLLDAEGRERGCWVEQPAGVQSWWLAVPREKQRDLLEKKMDWYADDAGTSTVREVVEMLEAAAAGRTVCPPLAP